MDELLLALPDAVVIVDERSDYELEETEPFYGIDANYQKEQNKIRCALTDLLFRRYDRLTNFDEEVRNYDNFKILKAQRLEEKIARMKAKCKNVKILVKNRCPHCYHEFLDLKALRDHIKLSSKTKSRSRSKCTNAYNFVRLEN